MRVLHKELKIIFWTDIASLYFCLPVRFLLGWNGALREPH